MSVMWGERTLSECIAISQCEPTGTCGESYCLLSSTSFQALFLDEIDLAQDSRNRGFISNGSVSRRSIPVCGVLLASARRCVGGSTHVRARDRADEVASPASRRRFVGGAGLGGRGGKRWWAQDPRRRGEPICVGDGGGVLFGGGGGGL